MKNIKYDIRGMMDFYDQIHELANKKLLEDFDKQNSLNYRSINFSHNNIKEELHVSMGTTRRTN